MTMVPRFTALLFPHRVTIVESHQPLADPPMQSQRVIQPVRFFRSCRDACHHKPHPVPTLGVNNQRDPVQVEQRVQRRIVRLRDLKRLSYKDNPNKPFSSDPIHLG
jgi:hypothetical protein